MHQQQTAFENIVGKGEIASNKKFLLFPQCFLLNQIIVSLFVHIFDIISLFATECEKPIIGISGKVLTHYHTMPHFDALLIYSCGKHCEKRRNCLLQAISPFLTMFSILYGTYFPF